MQINLAHYRIGVGQGGAQRTFMFDAYRRGTELDDTRSVWLGLVALLESTACPRITDDALRSIAAGRSAAFARSACGPGRGGSPRCPSTWRVGMPSCCPG